MNCPRCKGSGKMTLKVSTYGEDGSESIEINCVTCDGTGEVTSYQNELYKQEVAMWCRCGNPSGDVDYYEDGQDPVIQKHHWNCKDCGKVLQVG